MILLGIDPGKQTGLAIYRDGVLCELLTVSPSCAEALIEDLRPGRVIFEDSRRQSPVFPRGTSPRALLKIARNVGEIDQHCARIEALCKRLGIDAVGVSPQRKGSKLDADQFKAITGWPGTSNPHTRDAAMVAHPYRRMCAPKP